MRMLSNKGFTMIELLVVIAIIGIIAALVVAAVVDARKKAADTRVKNDIRQMRWLAEVAFDSQNGDFRNWSNYPLVNDDFNILLNDIKEAHDDASVSVAVGQSRIQTFCVSAPLVTDGSEHYCIDASRELQVSDNPCPTGASNPHVCP